MEHMEEYLEQKIHELHLLPKQWRKKGIRGLIFSRTGIIMFLMLLAAVSMGVIMTQFGGYIAQTMGGVLVFDVIVVISLLNTEMDSSAKLTWVLVIAATSVFGAMFYLYTRLDVGHRAVKAEYMRLTKEHRWDLPHSKQTLDALKQESPETARLAHYLYSNDAFPVSVHNDVTYYPLGEEKWADMLEELKKAEKFIFLEYFIIEEGLMWGSILNILEEKASQGVDVRVMYDGTCAIKKVPYSYPEKVRALGIKCKMFSPIRPFASTHYNYRDHRKILVIDGKVGFCGGVNLADEYINHVEIFGHWKDTALRIKGEGVRTLTHMFLNMWNYGEQNVDYSPYLTVPVETFPEKRGYVIPYGFNPFEKERVGERVYLDMLYNARNYVHIMSPYLILDDELMQALEYASLRGVDVRLILPGIPDKKAVYALAKTYLPGLLADGVKVYFYTPGFVHAKVFVSDDCKAVVGTINLDYRSLYHHFECGTYLFNVDCIADIERDFMNTQARCTRVTPEVLAKDSLPSLLLGKTLRMVAPLL